MQGSSPNLPITPTRQTANPFDAAFSTPHRIQLGSGHPVSPTTSSPGRTPLSPGDALRIRRTDPSGPELDTLFKAVVDDNVADVVAILHRRSGSDIRHPETGEMLVRTAAVCGAWRVVEALSTDRRLSHVVSEPSNGVQIIKGEKKLEHDEHKTEADNVAKLKVIRDDMRALDIAVQRMVPLDARRLLCWHRLMECVDHHDGKLASRIEESGRGFAKRVKLALSPSRQAAPDEPRVGLADPVELDKQLEELLKDFHSFLMKDTNEFAELSAPLVEKVKERLDMHRDAFQKVRTEMERWDRFLNNLSDLTRRPLEDPYAGIVSLHNWAMVEQDGQVELLTTALENRQRGLGLAVVPAVSQQTAASLGKIMEERSGSGELVKMTQQQVLLAVRYFEALPDSALLDTGSLQRAVEATLHKADSVHGGRAMLLQAMQSAISAADALLLVPDSLEHDPDPKNVRERRRNAEQADFGSHDSPLRQHNDRVWGEKSLEKALAPDEALPSYRTLQLYVALEKLPMEQLEIHPRHLMAACLRLSRQVTGRRDNADKPHVYSGDSLTVAKLKHAQHQVMEALEYRSAKGLVGRGVPNALLYRPRSDEVEGLPERSRSRSDEHGKASGSRARRTSFGKWLSPK